MAMRPQHTHDGGIMERRLRPIYDWLDNGNNKKALQEAEKVLKKSPSLQAARALKALALFRLSRASEAYAVLDALAEEKPSDDATLQAMTITYRESQRFHKVCALYEAAVKADPTSEELHSHLFMSYVRLRDYKAQQRVAMALYKLAPKNPYYFWAVMSIVLQAKTSEDSTKRSILLSLAQRMVDNFILEKKMEAEQEARLYIMILELQEKWSDILKFIESRLYSQLVPETNAQAGIFYLKKLGQWRIIHLICKELLWDNQDRWDYYLPYFESAFHLMKETLDNVDPVDNTPEKCHEFICQLVESVSSGRMLRGPYLARLELWNRLSVNEDPTALLGSSLALCIQYLRLFGNKRCVVPDLRPYLKMIPKKERVEKCRDFLTCLGFDENSEPESTDDIQRHISCLSLWRLTAEPLPASENIALADKFRDHYIRCLKNGLVTASPTEFCAADSYGILAAHHYFYAAVQLESSKPVLEALCLLELVLDRSPANFHVKLLLVKLYHVLGNPFGADIIYRKAEIKHIQLVSLGWWHLEPAQATFLTRRVGDLLHDTTCFHKNHAKDSVEYLTYAYKYGTFEKLPELYDWCDRLESCTWMSLVRREVALRVVHGPSPTVPLPPPPPLYECLTDNRDLKIIVNFEPPECQDPDMKSRSFDQNVAYLKLKDGLVSALSLCQELYASKSLEEKKEHYEQLNPCVDAFSEAIEKCKELYTQKEKISISGPFPSRIIAFVNSPVPYREMYSWVFRATGELALGHSAVAHAACERANDELKRAHQLLREELTLSGDRCWRRRELLESLSNFVEFVGVFMYLLGICYDMAAPTNIKKSKKKANQTPDELKTVQLLNRLNKTVKETLELLKKILDDIPNNCFELERSEHIMKLLEIDDQYVSRVTNKHQDDFSYILFLLDLKYREFKDWLQ